MAEVGRMHLTGLTAVSTFSGTGGSCLGLRMAGFKVLWASEFIEAARRCYAANFPDTPIDPRDIRAVTVDDILKAVDKRPGEIDLIEGSPPCASFSTAGGRAKKWGKSNSYSTTTQRTDDLFFEFARILKGIAPRAFIAENVSGLTKGVAKGWYLEIIKTLRACGYTVEARMLDAQWLGVPQVRQRVIFLGFRTDLGLKPVFPKPLPYRYSVRDAIGDLIEGQFQVGTKSGKRSPDRPAPTVMTHPRLHTRSELSIQRFAIGDEWHRLKPGQKSDKYFNLHRTQMNRPCPTVTQAAGNLSAAGITHPNEPRKFTIAEGKRICSFPDDFKLIGTYAEQWERLGRSVPPLMMRAIAEAVRKQIG